MARQQHRNRIQPHLTTGFGHRVSLVGHTRKTMQANDYSLSTGFVLGREETRISILQ